MSHSRGPWRAGWRSRVAARPAAKWASLVLAAQVLGLDVGAARSLAARLFEHHGIGRVRCVSSAWRWGWSTLSLAGLIEVLRHGRGARALMVRHPDLSLRTLSIWIACHLDRKLVCSKTRAVYKECFFGGSTAVVLLVFRLTGHFLVFLNTQLVTLVRTTSILIFDALIQ